MINSPFVHFQTRELFEKMKSNILDKSLVFIKDTNEIYSNNTTYSSFEILENTELSKNTLTPIAKINGQELKLKVESDKMDTTDNITISDIGQINPNYKNQYLEYNTITSQTMAFNGKPVIFGEYFVLVKNSSGGVCSVTIPVVSDTTFICTTNDVKIQAADSILFKIKTYDVLAVVDYEYLYDEPYLLLTKTITSTVYDNREYQAGETIAVLCEVTSVYVNRLSNEEITDTAWHDVEVTAPDSSGSVEIEADGVKDSLSVEVAVSAYYKVDLNSQWLSSSKSNPDSSLYEGVYESFSNYNVGSTAAIMYITISGYSDFTLYIRSYAESSYDYVMVSHLDLTITNSTTSSSTLVKAHTSGNQQSGTALSNYTKVEFTNIEAGEHKITIVYRKDSSVNSGDDKGYVLISKNNTIAGVSPEEPEETPDNSVAEGCVKEYFMLGIGSTQDEAQLNACDFSNSSYLGQFLSGDYYIYIKGKSVSKIKFTGEIVELMPEPVSMTRTYGGCVLNLIECNNPNIPSLLDCTDSSGYISNLNDEFYAIFILNIYCYDYVNFYIYNTLTQHTPICSVNDHDLLCDGAYTSETIYEISKEFNIYFNSNYKIKILLIDFLYAYNYCSVVSSTNCTSSANGGTRDTEIYITPDGDGDCYALVGISQEVCGTNTTAYTIFTAEPVEVEGEEEDVIESGSLIANGDFEYNGIITTIPTYFNVRLTSQAHSILFLFTGSTSSNPVYYTMESNNGLKEEGTNTYNKIGFYTSESYDLDGANAIIGFYTELECMTPITMIIRASLGNIDPS